jgi:hypothetical protein
LRKTFASDSDVDEYFVTMILEPIHKVVESEESVVIPSLAPESLLRGAECGSLNIGWRASPISWVGLSSKHTTGRRGSGASA